MKKKGLSMNLIMALTLTAVAVSVLLCANLVFMQTYRRTLLRNAETTSRQAIAQAGSTMNEYLENMDDAVTLLTGYLDLPAEEREARFEAFLEIRADVVAVLTATVDNLLEALTEGKQVDFGELGKFRLQIASVGTEKLTDFTAAHITGVNIQYVPGEDLKTIFGALEFQPVASRAAQAAALRAEKEGKAVADLLKTKDEPGV